MRCMSTCKIRAHIYFVDYCFACGTNLGTEASRELEATSCDDCRPGTCPGVRHHLTVTFRQVANFATWSFFESITATK